MKDIYQLAKELRLSYIKSNYETVIQIANTTKPRYEQFLQDILQEELTNRSSNAVIQRIRNAGFPNRKYLSDLIITELPKDAQNKMDELTSLDFVRDGHNLILIGNPGVGKTHLAIGLGIKACEHGYKVLYLSVPNLITQLKEATSNNQLTQFKNRFMSFDVVILDELGYISFDKHGGELLFNLISNRNEKKTTIITSNLEFSRWEEIFGDQILTTAFVDRVTFRSITLSMIGDSFRLKETIKLQNKGIKI